jgi:signal transduction histidine kinase
VKGRLHQLRLHSRIAIALLVVGALLVGVVAVSAVLQVQTRREQRRVVVEYYNALKTSQTFFIAMLNSETAIRGYALTHDRASLRPLEDAGEPWNEDLAGRVRRDLPEATDSLAQVREITVAARAWYTGWAAPTIAKVQRGEQVTPAEVEAGTRAFDQVRARYDAYLAGLRAGRELTAVHLRTLTDRLFAAVVLSALIAVLGAFILWVMLRRWVSRPIVRLGAETREVTTGNLDHEVSVAGPPDIAELGHDIEAMRERLVAQIAAVEESRRLVAQARASLEEQTQELQRSNRELEQFAYVASHDLQEPLRKVSSFCQMLERRYGGQLDERADQYIHFAVDGAQRMQQLINDLLEYSRVGRLTTPQVDVDLMGILRVALGNLETAIEESGAEVTWDDLPTVRGEAPLLTQVLQNVISNAIKFRSEAAPRIHIGVRREGEFWEFWCSDNGIGIEPQYAERVFQIFQRLHAKEVYSGTGIGLAIGKKIVEYHGGRIWIDPAGQADPTGQTGQAGATVRWTLPVSRAGVDGAHAVLDLVRG